MFWCGFVVSWTQDLSLNLLCGILTYPAAQPPNAGDTRGPSQSLMSKPSASPVALPPTINVFLISLRIQPPCLPTMVSTSTPHAHYRTRFFSRSSFCWDVLAQISIWPAPYLPSLNPNVISLKSFLWPLSKRLLQSTLSHAAFGLQSIFWTCNYIIPLFSYLPFIVQLPIWNQCTICLVHCWIPAPWSCTWFTVGLIVDNDTPSSWWVRWEPGF